MDTVEGLLLGWTLSRRYVGLGVQRVTVEGPAAGLDTVESPTAGLDPFKALGVTVECRTAGLDPSRRYVESRTAGLDPSRYVESPTAGLGPFNAPRWTG